MKYKIVIVLALFLITLMPGGLPAARATASITSEIDPPAQANILQAYAGLPLLFIRNQGQMDSQVDYYAKTPGQTVYLTSSGLVFDLTRYRDTQTVDSADRKAERLAISLNFVGANASPLIEGGDKDEAEVNYLIGNDPQKWHTCIPTCREVTYKDVYPGIDLRLYGKQGSLEYEFIVQPKANISSIALAYAGVDSLETESGELVAGTAFGDIKHGRPYIYQQIGDDRVAVAGGFKLLASNAYGFEVGTYDAGYPLVIDPSLSLAYSTYLGGGGDDSGQGIAVKDGYAYVTGYTASINFPAQDGYQSDQTDYDAFVTKIDTAQAGAASLIYSTYMGGNGTDRGYGIAVESGLAYVTGYTSSTDFPTLNQYQTRQLGNDAFITVLSASGDALKYSTYLGGNGDDYGRGIAVESAYAYVTGYTTSTNFPTLHGYQTDQAGDDAFVTRLDTLQSGNNSLMYSTYLGGSDADHGYGIAVEKESAYVTGDTDSIDFPTLNPYHADPLDADVDVFVTKLDTTKQGNTSLIYSTYLGGSYGDFGRGIAVENGYAYVTGYTYSTNFYIHNQYQANQAVTDAFVTRLNTSGNGLIYSTYLGGSGDDYGQGIAVENGYAYVTGYTTSTDFPTLNQFQTDPGDAHWDAFVTKLDTLQSGNPSLINSTYMGGNGNEEGNGIAVESACAYVTGFTDSNNFPTLNQYQTRQLGNDAFVTKFKIGRYTMGDYNGDSKSDYSIWRPATGNWYVYPSFTATQFGLSSDIPIPCDYNGDGQTEYAVWRSSTGNWYVYPSFTPTQFGLNGDIPVPGDYNGDGTTERAIYRPSDGNWYVYPSFTPTQFGLNGDVPVPGCYTTAGKTDYAIWRPSTGNWYVYPSFTPTQFGLNGDIPVPADYNGDGKDEFAIWRPSTGNWYVYPSFTPTQFGLNGDIPVPADYNGDGKAEYAIWRPSTGNWYVYPSFTPTQFGLNGDMPATMMISVRYLKFGK